MLTSELNLGAMLQAQGLDPVELALRVLIAGGLGALIGLEREVSDQPAGLRTHVLVSLGSALFTLSGVYGVTAFVAETDMRVDPTRIAAQVVTGIGFLGAGAIIRQGFSVKGLTTAAGLWVTAAIGTAVGLGFYTGAAATTGAAVIALYALKRFERVLLRRLKPGRWEYLIEARAGIRFADLTAAVEKKRATVESIRMEDLDDDRKHVSLSVKLPPRTDPHEFADALRKIDAVESVDWSR